MVILLCQMLGESVIVIIYPDYMKTSTEFNVRYSQFRFKVAKKLLHLQKKIGNSRKC